MFLRKQCNRCRISMLYYEIKFFIEKLSTSRWKMWLCITSVYKHAILLLIIFLNLHDPVIQIRVDPWSLNIADYGWLMIIALIDCFFYSLKPSCSQGCQIINTNPPIQCWKSFYQDKKNCPNNICRAQFYMHINCLIKIKPFSYYRDN